MPETARRPPPQSPHLIIPIPRQRGASRCTLCMFLSIFAPSALIPSTLTNDLAHQLTGEARAHRGIGTTLLYAILGVAPAKTLSLVGRQRQTACSG